MTDPRLDEGPVDPELDLSDHLRLLKRVKMAVTERKLALAAAEGRLAAAALGQILASALLIVLAAAAAWTLVCVALGFYFVSLGWSITLICLSLAGLNLLLAFLLVLSIRQLSRNLTFEATRRNLL